MPPKKRKGNAKKPQKAKPAQGDELELKYRSSVLDVAVLKEQIAVRTDVVRQALSVRDDLKCQIRDLKQELSQEKLDMKDISADLKRQYKTLQTSLGAKVQQLETSVALLQEQLDQCEDDLKTEREQRKQIEKEKDGQIADLQNKLDNMEMEYEKILHGCLDSLLSHLAEARRQWVEESSDIHQEFKDMLAEFGLNPLYI